MPRLLQTVIVASLLLVVPPVFGETAEVDVASLPPNAQVAYWVGQAATAYESSNHRHWVSALEALHELRPHNPDFMYQLVTGYALLDRKSEAFNMMLLMQRQGLAYDWDENPHLDGLRDTSLYDYLNKLMKEAGEHFGAGEVIATVDGRQAMPEALAHDPETGRLFVGTIYHGRILVRTGDGDWEVFADPESASGMAAIFDLAVDAGRGHLWVATGMASQFRGFRRSEFGRTGLLKLDLASGELISAHTVLPDGRPHLLGALAVAGDGTVYAADTHSPLVYRLDPGTERPQAFMLNPSFSSLRGIALSDDDRMLYMADYELGIFVADLQSEQAYQLAVPEDLNVAGVDGLFWWQDSLVIIQNGISPQRVMRLKLGADGLGVIGVTPLESSHPAFDHPTFGTLVGDDLVYFGATHWQKVDPRGRPAGGRRLPDIPILRTNVASEQVMVVGEEVLDELRRGQRTLSPVVD